MIKKVLQNGFSTNHKFYCSLQEKQQMSTCRVCTRWVREKFNTRKPLDKVRKLLITELWLLHTKTLDFTSWESVCKIQMSYSYSYHYKYMAYSSVTFHITFHIENVHILIRNIIWPIRRKSAKAYGANNIEYHIKICHIIM